MLAMHSMTASVMSPVTRASDDHTTTAMTSSRGLASGSQTSSGKASSKSTIAWARLRTCNQPPHGQAGPPGFTREFRKAHHRDPQGQVYLDQTRGDRRSRVLLHSAFGSSTIFRRASPEPIERKAPPTRGKAQVEHDHGRNRLGPRGNHRRPMDVREKHDQRQDRGYAGPVAGGEEQQNRQADPMHRP